MDKKKYGSAIINANYKSSLWMGVAAVLLLSNLMLAYFVMTADTTEKTIVTPPMMDTPFSVTGNEVSPEYIEQMARYFSQLLLTYHKANAQAQFNTVLHYTDPTVYSEMKSQFAVDYDRISRNDISSVFYMMGIHVKKNVAIITGELNGYIGSHLVSKQQKTYELSFRYNGALTITGFNEIQRDSTGGYKVVEQDEAVMIENMDAPGNDAAAAPSDINNEVSNDYE